MTSPFELNLRHVRGVAAIAARRTLSAAAAEVGLSQPALTQGLAKLERQLGARLFDRRADGVTPTAAGERVAARAEAAFAHLAQGVRSRRTGSRGFARPERLMTASQLQAFLGLVDRGSFVGAAEAVGISPPALHRAVRDLEQLCGTPLASRSGRALAITPAGRTLARGIRLAAAEIAAAIEELAPDAPASSRIVIGAMPLCRAVLLPRALSALVREGTQATLDVIEGSWRELVEPLRDGTIDVMVGALRDPAPTGLDQRFLFRDRLVVVGRADHPLKHCPEPTVTQLRAFPWIIGHSGTPLRHYWEALFAGEPMPPARVECGSVMVIRGMLLDSDLLTLLSPDQVAMEVAGGLLRTMGWPHSPPARDIGVTVRAGWRPTPAQTRLLELLAEAAADTVIHESE